MRKPIGPSLVVTALTNDVSLSERLLQSPLIERLKPAPINTLKISRDQPREDNLIQFLRQRRPRERNWRAHF